MAEIALRNGGVTLVDDADFEWLAQYVWAGCTKRSGLRYVITDSSGCIYMHRLIVGAADGMEVDHRNGDTLDNQRHNLREVTHAQNLQNRQHRQGGFGKTGYRNVTLTKGGRYHVKLQSGGKQRSFGTYDTVEEAAFVARQARMKHMPFSDESGTEIEFKELDWRPCPQAPGYLVTRDGQVRSTRGHRITPYSHRRGKTLYVSVQVNRIHKTLRIATLVAAAFSD